MAIKWFTKCVTKYESMFGRRSPFTRWHDFAADARAFLKGWIDYRHERPEYLGPIQLGMVAPSAWEEAIVHVYKVRARHELPLLVRMDLRVFEWWMNRCKKIRLFAEATALYWHFTTLLQIPRLALCHFFRHKWVSEDYATPDSGGMGGHCSRCGYSYWSQLY